MNIMKKHAIKGVCSVIAIVALTLSYYGNEIKTSEKGLLLIGDAEGCRHYPYKCPADVLTVGVGTTEAVGEKIEMKKYSDKEIAHLFAKAIKQAEQCVYTYANGKNMPQGAFDALTSITFNVGCGKLRNSTLFKMARNGYSKQMCDQFTKWVYAGNKKLTGLVIRRNKEKALCLTSN